MIKALPGRYVYQGREAIRANVASAVRDLQVWGMCCGVQRERDENGAGGHVGTRGVGFGPH